MMTTGKIVTALREKHRVSQRELVKVIGCSESSMRMYEIGDREHKDRQFVNSMLLNYFQ